MDISSVLLAEVGGRLAKISTRPALLAPLFVAALSGAPAASAFPPELGWSLLPGNGAGGAPDSQTSVAGPIQGTAANALPGVTSNGAATAHYGALSARTATTVNAALQTGAERFCVAPHCSEADAWWADRLVFRAPGGVAFGTPGSFTATLAITGALAASLSDSWSFVSVASYYEASVEIDHVLREQIATSCIDPPGAFSCFPVPLQILYGDPPVQKTPAGPFGTFALGPYDFTWGQPFDVEVRVGARALLDAAAQNAGISSASADLSSTVSFVGVAALFAGAGGTGTPVLLAAATVSMASGVDWIHTVPVPEPSGSAAAAATLALVAGLARVRRGRSPDQSAQPASTARGY